MKNDYIHCLVPISAENKISYTNIFLAQKQMVSTWTFLDSDGVRLSVTTDAKY